VLLFKVANAVFLAAGAAAVAIFLRRRCGLGSLTAGALGIAASVGIPTLVLSSVVMSEVFFFLLLMLALLAAERVVDGERDVGRLIALGVLAGAATLVRSHGIALVAAITLVLLVKRRLRGGAIVFASAAAVILPWQLWVRSHERFLPNGMYESYTSWLARGFHDQGFGLLTRTVSHTTFDLMNTVAISTAIGMPMSIRIVAVICVAILMVLGMRAFWRSAPTAAVFLPLYTAIVLAWPFAPVRFIWGVWPLMVVVPALGAVRAWQWRPATLLPRVARVLVLASVVFVAAGYTRYNVRGYRGHWWSSMSRNGAASVRSLVVWTRANTKPTDVVASNAEPLLYLYANRVSLPATDMRVEDYFRPATAVERADALRAILAVYPVNVVAIVAADSIAAGARSMTMGGAPELVVRDSFPNGFVFTPVHR
jgi:hypothetical protein